MRGTIAQSGTSFDGVLTGTDPKLDMVDSATPTMGADLGAVRFRAADYYEATQS